MLQERDGHLRLTFTFLGRRHFLSLGHVTVAEAEALAADATSLLRRVRRSKARLPERRNICTFLCFGGVIPLGYRMPRVGR
jgi:hypothetical protein